MNDGTFGVTGGVESIDADTIERLETHSFDPVRVLQWRNRKLDFSSLANLHETLRELPREQRLTRARRGDDMAALEALSADREIAATASTPANVELLWEVCQVPDYRKISAQSHAELIANLYRHLTSADHRLPEDWFAKQVSLADRTDGDIDTLATRIAHIRTWTFVANRPNWLKDPGHWQERTRAIEDSLSDALHEQLTQRFVDRRTSALMKGMRDKEELSADIAEDGTVTVESHFVGRLKGFLFTLDAAGDGIHEKATRQAAMHVVARELGMRTRRVVAAQNDAFKLARNGSILWRDDEIAKLERADDPLQPVVTLVVDERTSEADREKILARLKTWFDDLTAEKLKPLVDMSKSADLQGLARGVAFQLKESLGALKREAVASEIGALDQPARAELRRFGLRFGAFNIFFPMMLKPAAADLAATLWLLKNGGAANGASPELPRAGLTSAPADPETREALYRAYGFHVCGPRAIRLDILERLADLIRPLLAWRPSPEKADGPPKGSTGDGGFRLTEEMMSILGCSAGELGEVLKALGFRSEKRPLPAEPAETGESQPAAAPETPAPNAEAEPVADVETQPAAAAEAAPAIALAAASESTEPAQAVAETREGAEASENATAAADATASETEKFEEIWRPRRHQRSQRHEGARRDRGRSQRGPRKDQAPHAASSASPAGDGRAAAGAQNGHAPPAAGHSDASGRADNGSRRKEGWRGADAKRNDKGRPRRDREHRKDGRPRDEGRRAPQVITASPPKPSAAGDSSPFAALAALKERMEKQGSDST
jgi:ATP-dependent RNA helicase SUPV3L1/SUV3